jgi:Ala-tRNA(Pro) deacylase
MIDALKQYLEEKGIDYELVEHEERFTAAAEARASGVEPQDAAKDVLLRRGDEYVLATISASDRLDLGKVRDLLGEDEHVELATEDQIGADFGQFELGALPPFGGLLGVPQVVDRRLLQHERVLCNAGDHHSSVRVASDDLVRAADARTGDIVED